VCRLTMSAAGGGIVPRFESPTRSIHMDDTNTAAAWRMTTQNEVTRMVSVLKTACHERQLLTEGERTVFLQRVIQELWGQVA